MTEPMSAKRLAEIREFAVDWLNDGYDGGVTDASELLAEVDRLRAQVADVRSFHGNSIDPDECMECDMRGPGHQEAPVSFPCRTLAVLAEVTP